MRSISLSEQDHRIQLRRAVLASTVGTAIEWYDFFLYSTVTGLVFARLFFPRSDRGLAANLAAGKGYQFGEFGTHQVYPGLPVLLAGVQILTHESVFRPFASLLLMGIATFLVALVPTYQRIGIWGAVILTVLRFVQGVGVGGEWGGSVLLAMEWARTTRHRGFIASWPQFGVPAGLFLANLAVLAFSAISGDRFLVWGWRIPFLLSIVLVAVGFYIRLGIRETPVFTRLVAENKVEPTPIVEVMRRHPKEIALTALCRMGEQAPFYLFTAFVFAYGTTTLNIGRDFLLVAVLAASVVSFVSIPLFGHLSDRIGRKRVYMLGAALTGLFGFVYFAMLDTRAPALVFLAVVVSLIPHDMMYGPQAALIAECFTGRLRYSGASLGYQLASVIAGGPSPIIATWLLSRYASGYAIAWFIFVCALISVAAASLLPDYTNRDISRE